jgi:hypothetical protein
VVRAKWVSGDIARGWVATAGGFVVHAFVRADFTRCGNEP